MTARENILARLQASQTDLPHPAPWQLGRAFDDLVAQFVEALTAVHGEVFVAGSLAAASEKLHELLSEIGTERIVINDEAPLSKLELPQLWPDFDWYVAGQNEGSLRDFCAAAEVGISGAEIALAETGSVLIHSGPGKSRLATLLPPVHIALLSSRKIVPDLFAYSGSRASDIPSNLTFVSGPSKTADIEQTMAIGVHGPKRFVVIVYDEPDP